MGGKNQRKIKDSIEGKKLGRQKRGKKNMQSTLTKKSSTSRTSTAKRRKSVKATKEIAPKEVKTIGNLSQFKYEQLIVDHRDNGRKLARSILRKWRVHMPAEEIDSIVDLGLCEAAQRFSPKKGASFMTFFFYHLRGHLVRAVARATQANTILNGPQDEDEDLTQDIISSYGTFIDNELNAQRDQETPENLILRREKITFCRDAMKSLDELERVVLERSFGEDETLVDIAKSLGYSRCHISRVKKTALIRLKSVLSSNSSELEGSHKIASKVRVQRNDKTTRRKLEIKKLKNEQKMKAA